MNLKNFFLWISFFTISSLHATSQEIFLQANDAYAHKNFEQAKELYESIPNKGPAVWYNLGNCWYHLDNYVEALVCWKRALHAGGGIWYDDIITNCQKVAKMLHVEQKDGLFDIGVQKIALYSLLFWQLLLLFSIVILCLVICFTRRNMVVIGCLSSVVGVFLISSGIKYYSLEQKKLIVSQDCYLIAGTDERFSKIAPLKKGQEVALLEQRDSWSKIKGGDGAGWILSQNGILI